MIDNKIIFDRLKEHANAVSDADVARALGISPQAYSSFKKKNKLPPELIINYCLKHHISVDWLLTGEGPMKRGYDEPMVPLTVAGGERIPYKEDSEIAELIFKLRAIYNEPDYDDEKARVVGTIMVSYGKIKRAKENSRHGQNSSFPEKEGEQKSA